MEGPSVNNVSMMIVLMIRDLWLTIKTYHKVARIRELEEENRQLRIQNEKQQALVNKYRERWEKLKESAKKRRAQPDQV